MQRPKPFWPDLLGIISIFLTISFWEFMTTPSRLPVREPYDLRFVMGVSILSIGGGLLCGLIAGIRGSRWWLLSLLGPVFCAMTLLSSRT
jgi:hypothetical protein